MPARTGRFRRSERLLVSRDFRRVSRRGRRTAGAAFILLMAPRDEAAPASDDAGTRRLGIAAGRKVGNAVMRNRIKRGVREWFRHRRESLPSEVDIVVIARRPAADLAGPEIAGFLDALVERAGGVRRSRR